jgi:hypothetical protein
VLVTWIDFHSYDWDVRARESGDGGTSFGGERPVNVQPRAIETLEASPHAALGPSGAFVAFTDWRKSPASARTPSSLYDVALASPGGHPRKVDGTGSRHVNAFWPAVASAPGGGALVAWQDMRRGVGEIHIARVGNRVGRSRRIDGHGSSGNAWRPAIALSGRAAVVAWEDDRDGLPQIYVTRQPLPFTTSRP